ncbi:receptor-like protein 12, partial [Vigna radiata var. radiata]|uniref:Receptor-like protein 12 n=1 Tax=Vigna radiata var. radiata TaxID=3916 RepID=A0A1S3VWB1_VIGRR
MALYQYSVHGRTQYSVHGRTVFQLLRCSEQKHLKYPFNITSSRTGVAKDKGGTEKVAYGQHHIRCLPKERDALLQFKAVIVDHNGMLSSWTTPDCCQWEGIRCTNLTAHIISLHLSGQYNESLSLGGYVSYEVSQRYIGGEIHKSLMELRQLQYLNLSFNYFRDSNIPEFLGSLTNLRYLDLSSSYFSGKIPTQISYLSHLKYLNLATNYYLNGSIPRELGNLSQLQYLDLSGNSFEGSVPSQIGNLSRLQYLDLRWNCFEGYIPSQLGNLSNLHKLYLGGYHSALKIVTSDQWLSNLNSLTHLSFNSISNFNSSPSWLRTIAKLPKLRELSLIECGLSDHFLLSFNPSNLNFSTSLSILDFPSTPSRNRGYSSGCQTPLPTLLSLSFEILDLSSNQLTGKIPDFSILKLETLNLSMNQISGTLPNTFKLFPSLKRLYLDNNMLNGTISEDLRFPTELEELSLMSNSLKGVLSDSHFYNMTKLRTLMLSDNSLTLDVSQNWGSAFQLDNIELRSCKLGPLFPKWLEKQNKFQYLDISNTGISGSELMFTNIGLSLLKSIDLSYNQLSGEIPKEIEGLLGLVSLNLSRNQLTGKIPSNVGELTSLEFLDLSRNQLVGSIPSSLAQIDRLTVLDLSHNYLSGKIPTGTQLQSFDALKYEDNVDLCGPPLKKLCIDGVTRQEPIVAYGQHHIRCIPKERDALLQFKAAIVDRYGMLSSWTTPHCCQWEGIRCNNLTAHIISLDLHGEVHYEYFSRGNYEVSRQYYISGEIHKSLMELPQLQYLNLSFNYFLDTNIPEFLGSLTNLRYLDLSSSYFSGQIPSQISSLSHLKYLNLADNYYLDGSIPLQLGNLSRLEYLDLSYNSFGGYIPSQLGNLSNLHTLYLGGYDSALQIVTSDHWLSNLTSLTHLYLYSISNFNSSPSWLRTIAKLPKLRELSLIQCGLSDHFLLSFNPSNFNFSTSLSVLHLSGNSFTQPM